MYLTDQLMRDAGPPIKYDNTMLTAYDSHCRRFFYYFWRGLDYTIRPSYFTWGSAWQEAQTKWYLTDGPPEEKLRAGIQAAEKFWADSGSMENGNDTLENLKYLLMFYALEYEREPWQVQALGDEMELGFEFPLPGTEYYLTGALDGYIIWNPHGILILECKTTGMYLSPKFMEQWAYSPQITQYIWGLYQLLGEEPFGALMNCVSKRLTLKAKTAFKNDGTMPEGCFARNLEKRTSFELAEFERDSLRIIEDIDREWEHWEWRKTRFALNCTGGIGKSPCLFRGICRSETVPWDLTDQDLLKPGITWRKEEWTPWERGGKKDEVSKV